MASMRGADTAFANSPRSRARLRDRIANMSVKTAFFLYAAAGILVALVLSFVVTGVLGLVAESTLVEDRSACRGARRHGCRYRDRLRNRLGCLRRQGGESFFRGYPRLRRGCQKRAHQRVGCRGGCSQHCRDDAH